MSDTNDRFGASRGLLLELLTYYIHDTPDCRIEWNYKRNQNQIDALSISPNEIRFFECKLPLNEQTTLDEIKVEAKKFKDKVDNLTKDTPFCNEWNYDKRIPKIFTFVAWKRPRDFVLRYLDTVSIDVIVLSEQLKYLPKLQGKNIDTIKLVFSDVPPRIKYNANH